MPFETASPHPSSAHPTARSLLWQRLDRTGVELARCFPHDGGVELAGRVLLTEERAPLEVTYRILCDASWTTRAVEVEEGWHGAVRTLRLDHDGAGRWRRDGAEEPALSGCLDVDLEATPATNALPLNRLPPPPGGRCQVRAAFVRVPGLEVVPARQAYQDLGGGRCRYTSLTSGFTAELEVDADGFPLHYQGIWRREAEGPLVREVPSSGMARALLGPGVPAVGAGAAAVFGWLIGGWSGRVRDIETDGTERSGTGEWWFSWALEGRALQDVFIVPSRVERGPGSGGAPGTGASDRFGSTLRWLDPSAPGRWQIAWINPPGGTVSRLEGGPEGDRIVLLGEEGGRRARWTFGDIEPDSFVWRGESQDPDGTWRLESVFEMRRIA